VLPALRAEALPPGFYQETVVSGLFLPVYLTPLPDGRMLVVEKGGRILIFDPSNIPAVPSTYMELPNVATDGELGAASLALHPDFEHNGYFYLYYSHAPSQRNRVSRFTHLGSSADPASEVLIWQDNEPYTTCCHFGGGVAFGADGNLYITTGEEFDGDQSQDLTRAGGKIIRVADDGSIPP